MIHYFGAYCYNCTIKVQMQMDSAEVGSSREPPFDLWPEGFAPQQISAAVQKNLAQILLNSLRSQFI